MDDFTDIRALIIDMDGVLWHGNQALPGLNAFFDTLRQKALPFILATNNARSTQAEYVAKLGSMGVIVSPDEVLTSSMATAHYLAQQYEAENTNVFVIGEHGLIQPLQEQGFNVLDMDSEDKAGLVVCGLDKTLDWHKLAVATTHIFNGAALIGSNADVTLPTETGFAPGNGAILAALSAATGVKAQCFGKPEPFMYRQAMEILQAEKRHTIAIGDRLDTDILGAVRAGIRSLMVLSGVSTLEDVEKLDYRPDWVMQDIVEVTAALQRLDS